MVRRSYNAVLERNVVWEGEFATEPYETAWASEAIFFIRSLRGGDGDGRAEVQISPDGLFWCNEGTTMPLPRSENEVICCRVSNFGGWLRLKGTARHSVTVLVTLCLKE